MGAGHGAADGASRISDPAARRDGLRLVVEDDGPGIPVEERARVLERGARLDERVSGQGIGLSVVRELVAAQWRHDSHRRHRRSAAHASRSAAAA